MIQKKTLLILGAGASAPYGFPTGKKLIEQIVNETRAENGPLNVCLRAAGAKSEHIYSLRKGLESTQFDSIDRFLEFHPELIKVGKLAIAAELIPKERPERLRRPEKPAEHWYQQLFQQMVVDGRFSGSKVSIISLNYDRSLQEYLFQTVTHDLPHQQAEAARVVLNMEYVYLHGNLGDVAWRPTDPSAAEKAFAREYSPEREPDLVRGAADRIRIISEVDWHNLAEFRYHVTSMVTEAEVIGFIGFGYHQEILERLNLHRLKETRPSVEWYGSAMGLQEGRKREVIDQMDGIGLGTDKQDACAFLGDSRLIYQGKPRLILART